jgi:hypothetical protein
VGLILLIILILLLFMACRAGAITHGWSFGHCRDDINNRFDFIPVGPI